MAKLIYSYLGSVDGYVADAAGGFDWAAPDPEVHAFINEAERPIGCYLYGRRMYETMQVWETDPTLAEVSPVSSEFARIWAAADKIIFSTTLTEVSTANTRLLRRFDPETVREWKRSRDRDLSVGGPGLAAAAFAAQLVDEVHAYLVPEVVGSGKPALPDLRFGLAFLEQRRFGNGTVLLRYRCQAS